MDEQFKKLEARVADLEGQVQTLLKNFSHLTQSPGPTLDSDASQAPLGPMGSSASAESRPVTSTTAHGQAAASTPVRLSTTQQMFSRKATAKTEAGSPDSASKLLPLIAVICFVLAAVFMVRLAIESGWLTAQRQWGLLTLFGSALAVAGRWLSKIEKDNRVHLSAAGIIVLYISSFSGALYFEVLSWSGSLGLAMLTSWICLSLFHYHRSELFAVLATVGTYISPLMLGSKTDLIFDANFFLLWGLVFASVSTFLKTRTLALTACYLGIGVFTLRHSQESDPTNLGIVIAVLVVQFLTFTFGVFQYSVRNKTPLSEKLAWSHFPILLFFYGTTYYFLNKMAPAWAPWISLGFGAVVYAFYKQASGKLDRLQSQQMVQAFLSVILFHSGYLQIFPDLAKPWLLPTLLLLQWISEQKKEWPRLSWPFRWAFAAIAAVEFGRTCFELITSTSWERVFPGLVTLAVGLFSYFRGHDRIRDQKFVFLGLLHWLAILSLYRLAYEGGSLAVSFAWGVYSLLILAGGFVKRDAALAQSSLIVLVVAALKALIYDSSQAPSMVRIGSLIVTGILLYGAGLALRQIQKWPQVKVPEGSKEK